MQEETSRETTPRDERLGVIRIIVVNSGEGTDNTEAAGAGMLGEPAPMSADTTAALARLGDPVELLRAQEADELAALTKDPSIDLVLFDRVARGQLVPLLNALANHGPPSVAVIASDDDEEGLEAFRAGASDCIHFGPEYDAVLPVVLLEQVSR